MTNPTPTDGDAVPTTLGPRLPRKEEQAKPRVWRKVRGGVYEVDGKMHTDLDVPPPPPPDASAP